MATAEQVAAVFLDNYGGVHKYLLRRTGNPQDAEDLTHDVFLKALTDPPPDDRNLRGWLIAVAHNAWISSLRHNREIPVDEDCLLQEEGSDGDAEEMYLRNESQQETRQQAGSALLLLPEQQRVAILLRAEGLEYHEIAAAQGVPLGTAQTRVHRARLAMRASLSVN